MNKLPSYKAFIALSVFGHLVALYPAITPGSIEFNRPISASSSMTVSLAAPTTSVPQYVPPRSVSNDQAPAASPPQLPLVPKVATADEQIEENGVNASQPEEPLPITPADDLPAAPPIVEEIPPKTGREGSPSSAPVIQPPLRKVKEFLSLDRETLTYQVKLRGVPVGSAQMEASSIGDEFRISLKMNSTPALSAIYQVQSQIETRHIGGNFIITKIRRQEGNFRSDRGFTISLRDKSVFWADLLKRRSTTETIPTSEVLDPFSALYLLRNRPLQIGKTELLHVYDGDAYSELPVEIVRAEQMHLPGKGDVQTLVLKPQLRHDAVFSRTGEMLIWVTNDEFKVPVKVETSILLGKVTAELVSAESVPFFDVSLKSPSSAPKF